MYVYICSENALLVFFCWKILTNNFFKTNGIGAVA
jgi:hypothetical protein